MPESQDSPTPQAGVGKSTGQFSIQKIYVKDLSFETPNSPDVFRTEWRPDVDLQLNSRARSVAQHLYEVVVMVTVTARLGERTAFLAEVQQAGIFGIKGLSEQERGPLLGSYCPNILFPYAREAVSDLVTRGGFPQVLLAPVNFDALYAKRVEEARRAEGQPAGKTV